MNNTEAPLQNEEFSANNVQPRPSAAGFGRAIIVFLLLSLVMGALGSGATLWYVSKNPSLRSRLFGGSTEGISQQVTLREDSSVIDVVKKASPAVVSVVISKDINKLQGFGTGGFELDPFSQFFGMPPNQPKSSAPNVQQVGAGSGFFVTKDGLILTNKHVVSDEQASYTVVTSDGKTLSAKVVARDPGNDLAILKAEVTDAPTLTLADSGKLEIGQKVIAIGNSLGQYQNTVTTGVVSGIGRSITAGGSDGTEQLEGVIQTDAAINPGNSGGPLLDVSGQVVGINTAIDRGGQLVGFAIPAREGSKSLQSYKANGKITRPYLGVRYLMITKSIAEQEKLPKDYGALVIRGQTNTDFAVIPGSPADKAGVVENDIILEANGQKLDDQHSLAGAVRGLNVGDTLTLRVYHKGSEKDVTVKLEASK